MEEDSNENDCVFIESPEKFPEASTYFKVLSFHVYGPLEL